MTARKDQLVLGILIGGVGNHVGAWRRPGSRIEEKYSLSLFSDLARWAEDAKLHAVFLADGLNLDRSTLRSQPHAGLEPVTLLSALAAQTKNIGLIGSISTTFSEPYNVARQLASLDHLSNGRAGWNIVTSAWGEENFGRELPAHADRYALAEEYLRAALALWDSWDTDAIKLNREEGLYADQELVREINYRSKHFTIQGPLNIARPPQGRPLIAQAGSSESGKTFAAGYADIVFTTGRQSLVDSQAFYADLKARVASAGREPGQLKILPGISPIIGQTETEAKALQKELNGYIDFESGRTRLAKQLAGTDLSGLELTDRIPPERLPAVREVQGRRSRYEVFRELILKEGYTLRQLIEYEVSSAGHFVPVGDPEQIADLLQERFENGGADGFILLPSYVPEGFQLLTHAVVPILQERGLFQREYAGSTLRGNLGLDPVEDFRRDSAQLTA